MIRIAIIGAGFSGCYLASKLSEEGVEVTLFEKSRGVGGRMATRYVEPYSVNIGCFQLTPVDARFAQFCRNMQTQNILHTLDDESYTFEKMNEILKPLIAKTHLITQSRIATIQYVSQHYHLIDTEEKIYSGFDALFVTIPAPQLLELKFEFPTNITKNIESVDFESVATMVLYGKQVKTISRQKLATLRHLRSIYSPNDDVLVIHMDSSFSAVYAHLPKEALISPITEAIVNVLPDFKIEAFDCFTHLWRYGFTHQSLGEFYRFDTTFGVGIVADWMVGKSVEDAYKSVEALISSSGYRQWIESARKRIF